MRFIFCKVITIILLVVIISSLSGCWDSNELDTLTIVLGVGIDTASQPDEINLIVQTGKLMESTSGKDKTSGEESYQIMEARGKSVLEIVDSLNQLSSRLLYMHHNDVIIFGEAQAEKGIEPYLDYFIRDDESRMEVRIFIAEGYAKDILTTKPDQEKMTSVSLSRMSYKESKISKYFNVNLLDFISKFITKTTSPVVPIIRLIKEDEEPKLELSGMAVFKQDKMVGQLDEYLTWGYAWAMGGLTEGILNVQTEEGSATFNINSSSCKSDVILNDGSVKVNLSVKGTVSIGELQGFENMKMDEIINLVRHAAEEKINSLIGECFSETQKLNADIYGFGSKLYQTDPKAWKSIESRWDEIYPAIEMNINTKVTIPDTGKIADSL